MFHEMWGGFWFGWLFWIVVLILLIWLVVTNINKAKQFPSAETPIDILKRRFANGEISKEEFEEKKRILS